MSLANNFSTHFQGLCSTMLPAIHTQSHSSKKDTPCFFLNASDCERHLGNVKKSIRFLFIYHSESVDFLFCLFVSEAEGLIGIEWVTWFLKCTFLNGKKRLGERRSWLSYKERKFLKDWSLSNKTFHFSLLLSFYWCPDPASCLFSVLIDEL